MKALRITFVSQEVTEEPKKMGPDSLLRQKVQQKRWREGYEAGLSTTHRTASALAFLMSDAPVEMLGQYSRCALCLALTRLLQAVQRQLRLLDTITV